MRSDYVRSTAFARISTAFFRAVHALRLGPLTKDLLRMMGYELRWVGPVIGASMSASADPNILTLTLRLKTLFREPRTDMPALKTQQLAAAPNQVM